MPILPIFMISWADRLLFRINTESSLQGNQWAYREIDEEKFDHHLWCEFCEKDKNAVVSCPCYPLISRVRVCTNSIGEQRCEIADSMGSSRTTHNDYTSRFCFMALLNARLLRKYTDLFTQNERRPIALLRKRCTKKIIDKRDWRFEYWKMQRLHRFFQP